MSSTELPKTYDPKSVEDRWYASWEQGRHFHASVHPDRKPYTIVIPPPNITGILTMGHILNNAIQDILIRYKRMQGFEACWVPGTDHAGIATQNVVEKALARDGVDRRELGREKFVERVWSWREEYGKTIIRQLRKLGVSADWDRERFTMDEGLSEAVKEVFVRMFDKGLIYRGKYIVNWCPFHQTALSDDEVDTNETEGSLYYVRYRIEGTNDVAVVATTRPETMLGDTALCVNPKDERYKHLIGRTAILPIVGRRLPIIADDYIDTGFGTGFMKVTPAHDANDFLLGQRHNLAHINVMTTNGVMNHHAPSPYEGLDRFECRKRLVKDLQEQGFIEKIDKHTVNLGKCYRCQTVIEPYLSDQWFVRMQPLAKPALRVVKNGSIKFYPERWVKVYEHWMDNIRDWCISRQLWWGHRIPVYFADDGRYTAARNEAEARTKLQLPADAPVRQDEDVLDTWFSSWLWPMSVFGWPEDSKDLRYFNPTDTLVTGPDIIFFWVARMVMSNMEFMRDMPNHRGKPRHTDEELIPFRSVYFTSIIRDSQGRKMSKSLGNSPDPLAVIDEYGADALRYTMAYLAPLGQDVLFSTERCEIGRNFANKVWNAGRFLLMNADEICGARPSLDEMPLDKMDLADRWILSRLQSTIRDYHAQLGEFRINEVSKLLYDFIWHDFCDWYVELAKARFTGDEPSEVKKAVVTRALWVFDQALRLLHPFMPFISEELWQHLTDRKGALLIRAAFPTVDDDWIEESTERRMAFVQRLIESVRTIRGENNLPPGKELRLLVIADAERADTVTHYQRYISRLVKASSVELITASQKPKLVAGSVVDGTELYVPLAGLIDLGAERARVEKEIARLRGLADGIAKKLENESFVQRAPKEIVEKEREKRASVLENIAKLEENLASLRDA
ncbi:MAG: valine--tRNA ligase [Bacteroidetes bacterium]|jgi:valyl-tRNA synthetase|nr:valine--tRNA ligase [Bacteroidota bacterium]